MLSCKETAELASQSLDTKLTLRQKMGLRLHLMMCKSCCNFTKRLKFFHSSMGSQEQNETLNQCEESLSSAARERIRQKLSNSK
jgi:hypothetical protein